MKNSSAVFPLIVCFLFATLPSASHTEGLSAAPLKPETKLALKKLESQNPALLNQKAGDYWSDSPTTRQSQPQASNPPAPKGDNFLTGFLVGVGATVVTLVVIAAVAVNNLQNQGVGAGIGGSC